MSSRSAQSSGPARKPGIDGVECLRAGSAGLTVLFVGGALTRLVTTFVPTSRFWWLPVVAICGYFLAGSRVGDVGRPTRQGALAALVAWFLVAIGRLGWGFAGYTTIATFAELLPAVAVGALAGWDAGRRADRAAERQRLREAERRKARTAGKAERRARRRGGDPAHGPSKSSR